jgi:hypothetical protein
MPTPLIKTVRSIPAINRLPIMVTIHPVLLPQRLPLEKAAKTGRRSKPDARDRVHEPRASGI